MLLFTACAVDNTLNGKTPDTTVGETADTGVVDTDTTVTSSEEVCDGVDNDGDGWVDEGFVDADGNGRADCQDATCPDPALADATAVTVAVCEVPGDHDAFAIEEEWSVDLGNLGTWVTPLVGNLSDTNGDGVADTADIPDIVVSVCSTSPWSGVIAGDGSGVRWSVEMECAINDALVADLDGDGQDEVIFSPRSGPLQAYRGDGTPMWTSELGVATNSGYTACDLEGDGTVEIVSSVGVFDGATGALRAQAEVAPDGVYTTTVCADLDQDGIKEFIVSGVVYGADGRVRWSVREGEYGLMVAPIQADTDDAAELVLTGFDDVTLLDDDGSALWVDTLASTLTGAPCVADLDGDGAQEFVTSGNGALEAWEVDGTRLWRAENGDTSGFAGCSTFDVDRDGVDEVLFAGERAFHIYDGATGVARFSTTDHLSSTLYELPVVADVDGDDSAEIVLMTWSETGSGGVSVWGHPDNLLAPVGPTWGIHDFDGRNQAEDGTIVASPTASWRVAGEFRGRQAGPPITSTIANLRVSLPDVCVADCTYGPTSVTLRVDNDGEKDVPAGAVLTLRDDGTGDEVWSTTLPAVPSGQALAEIGVALGVTTGRFTATVDAGDAVIECDEADNVATWTDSACP